MRGKRIELRGEKMSSGDAKAGGVIEGKGEAVCGSLNVLGIERTATAASVFACLVDGESGEVLRQFEYAAAYGREG